MQAPKFLISQLNIIMANTFLFNKKDESIKAMFLDLKMNDQS